MGLTNGAARVSPVETLFIQRMLGEISYGAFSSDWSGSCLTLGRGDSQLPGSFTARACHSNLVSIGDTRPSRRCSSELLTRGVVRFGKPVPLSVVPAGVHVGHVDASSVGAANRYSRRHN